MAVVEASCTHLPQAPTPPRAQACEGCGSTHSLRACAHCGYVGCCESQLGHNTQHARQAAHPVIRSLPISERSFTWCYSCDRYL